MTKQIRRVNIFRSLDSHSERDIRNELLSTRVYIITLIVFVALLVEYSLFTINTKTITLNLPSSEQIVRLKNVTPVCPCSTSHIPYGVFSSVHPIFHPICSSDFVSDRWLASLEKLNNSAAVPLCVAFRIVSLVCELARKTLDEQLHRLSDTPIANPNFLTTTQLQTEVDAKVKQTVLSAQTTLCNSLKLYRNITDANKLLSISAIFQPFASLLNYYSSTNFEFKSGAGGMSSLVCVSHGDVLSSIEIPDFDVSGNGLEKLLLTSFMSFYNEKNVELLSSLVYTNRSLFLRPLAFPQSYGITDTIESIFNTLMLDNYTQHISYSVYFDACHPKICLYTLTRRNTLIETLSIVLAVIGGMTSALRLIAPNAVKFVTRPKRNVYRPILPSAQIARKIILHLAHRARSFNLFKNSTKVHHEIASTRLYLIILLVFIIVIIFYTSLTYVIQLVTITSPTYDQFTELDAQHSSSLRCPCSNLAVEHRTFVTLSPRFHQICSSDFVDESWFKAVHMGLLFSRETNDFRYVSEHMCKTILTLCQLSQRAVDERLSSFGQTPFISTQAVNDARLREQMSAIIRQSIEAGERQSFTVVKLARDITYANQVSLTS